MGEALLEQPSRSKMRKISLGNPFIVGDMAGYDVSGIDSDQDVLMKVTRVNEHTPGTATETFHTGLKEIYAIGFCFFGYSLSHDGAARAEVDMFYRYCVHNNDFSRLSSGSLDTSGAPTPLVYCQYSVSAEGDVIITLTNRATEYKTIYLFGMEVWGK